MVFSELHSNDKDLPPTTLLGVSEVGGFLGWWGKPTETRTDFTAFLLVYLQ